MTKTIDQLAAIAELALRKTWALARLGELVNAGRAEGWLSSEARVETADSERLLATIDAKIVGESPMRLLRRRLDLSTIEMNVLWLLVAIELEPVLARGAQTLASPGMHELNAQILERLAANDDAASDGDVFGRLAGFGLIETDLDPRVPLYRRPVRPNDRVIALARGQLSLDEEVTRLARLIPALDTRRETAALDLATPDELAHAMTTGADVFVVATGAEGSGRATLLRHAASTVGRAVLAIQSDALATDTARFSRQLRAIARECRLLGAWPLLLNVDSLGDRAATIERELIASHPGPVLVTSREACTWQVPRPVVTIAIALPDEARRQTMWERVLPETAGDVTRAAARRYAITPALLQGAASGAIALAQSPERVTIDHLHGALRTQLERRLVGFARRVETRQTWDDLVLPVDQFDLLVELVARVRHRKQVLETWGFADKVGRGLGLSVLLSGPPGTGKTMIAGLIAGELGLDLYQVDLSRIVSKYIGETEKQLATLFEAAESGHAVLLFDEADSLFAKRTEVKSSNDRYANLEVNYLLQRMESFSGISVLTTNHETAIDAAFQRRLALHVRVPMPDQRHRELLWQAMFPARVELAGDLDLASLAAEFVMSGGYIRNAVLRAAYFAADQVKPIHHAHLYRAARAEYEAMGKIAYEPHVDRGLRRFTARDVARVSTCAVGAKGVVAVSELSEIRASRRGRLLPNYSGESSPPTLKLKSKLRSGMSISRSGISILKWPAVGGVGGGVGVGAFGGLGGLGGAGGVIGESWTSTRNPPRCVRSRSRRCSSRCSFCFRFGSIAAGAASASSSSLSPSESLSSSWSVSTAT